MFSPVTLPSFAVKVTPFTVTFPATDLDFDGFGEGRPVLLDPSILYRSIDTPATSQELLPRSAFRAQVYGDTVDMLVPRNSFYGDGFEYRKRHVELSFL